LEQQHKYAEGQLAGLAAEDLKRGKESKRNRLDQVIERLEDHVDLTQKEAFLALGQINRHGWLWDAFLVDPIWADDIICAALGGREVASTNRICGLSRRERIGFLVPSRLSQARAVGS
jgi:hypothetical protein